MSNADELAHQIKFAAGQQTDITHRLGLYGHISSYDAATHRVRLVVPSLTDGAGNYVLTSWMPLATLMAGNAWGVQIAPMGGASIQNPTQGEQCEITLKESNYGVAVCAQMTFNQVFAPPFTSMSPGEMALKANSGSYLYFHSSGQVEINVPEGDLTATVAQGNVSVTASAGTATIEARGNVAITSDTAEVTLSAQSEITMTAPTVQVTGNLEVNGNIGVTNGTITWPHGSLGSEATITGDLQATGTITGDTDVVGAGKSLSGHTHAVVGVQGGGGTIDTGPPL